MTAASERYARIAELFQDAAELVPEERHAWLHQQCGEDAELRQEVEALLAADPEADGFMEKPIAAIPDDLFPPDTSDDLTGQRFGPYEVIREIGRGGLGTVHLAARADDAYRKEVALKLLRRGVDTDDVLRRFRNERQILAQLDHPNIARLLDGGTSEDGRPFFVMEHVEGQPLIRFCESQELPLKQRLELFRKVCAAVSYAHQNLVIHRDLKPSNILVCEDGTPKLLDFGIAKVLTPEDEFMTQTIPALRVMTPEYASPEQIKGGAITTSSDVYSLGVLLYELLTGQKPYRLTSRTTEEISRAMTAQEPARPSTAVVPGAPTEGRSSSGRNPKLLRGDLDNIVLMALRKEPERRYPSVESFSEDIRRHLEGLPVSARQDTLSYRTQKFIQRNKVRVAAAASVLLTLMGGLAITLVQAERVVQERNRARKEAAKASRINTFLQDVLAFSDPSWLSSNPNHDHEATVSEALETAGRRATSQLTAEPEVAAAVHFTLGWTYKAMGKLDKAEPHLKTALDIRRRVLGEDDQDTAQGMIGMGELLIMRGQGKEGEALTRAAVDIYRRAQGKTEVDAKWFAVALSNLAYVVKTTKGQEATCEALLREAVAVSADLKGADRAPIPIFYGNLGDVRNDLGDLDGSIAFARKAIEEQRRLPGDTELGMGNFLNNLGVALMVKGDYPEAERLLSEALKISQKTVGENHPSIALYRANLSGCFLRAADYRRALEEAKRAVEIQEKSLPAGHPHFVRSWMAMGNAFTHLGEEGRGEDYLRRALALAQAKLPTESRFIALAEGALGENLLAQKRYAEAEGPLRLSRDMLQSRMGDQHPQTQRAEEQLRLLEQARAE